MDAIKKYVAFPEHAQCRILVFNDCDNQAAGVAELLESMGYTAVTSVTDGAHAMPSVLDGNAFDTAIIDVRIPTLDGLKNIEQIRLSRSAAELPILAISDAGAADICNAALLAGANDHLDRPVNPIDLALRLRNLLTIRGIYTSSQNIQNDLENQVAARTAKLKLLTENGLLMSRTRDRTALIRHTLFEGRSLLHCDAATLYLVTENKTLRFSMRTMDDDLAESELQLYDTATGEPNRRYAATWCALEKKSVLIDDVYQETEFDLSGTRSFDAATGYRTVSTLTVPMIARDGDALGVLQFVNKLDPQTNAIVPFPDNLVPLVEALAAQAAVTMDNLALYEAQAAHFEVIRRLGNQIAQLDRQRSLGSMSASLGHELNQPLASILTNAQVARRAVLQETVNPAQVVDFLDKIVRNTQRASAIVERIQRYIRPSASRHEPVNLNQVTLEVMELIIDDARRCGAVFVPPVGSAGVHVLGDPVQFSQIILNVFRNALEAMEHEPQREIHVSLHCDAGHAILRIRDTGPGLSPQALAQAGAPHFTTKQTGLGLGLSISRAIAEQFAGTLKIENAVGGGAVVELTLPALAASDAPAP